MSQSHNKLARILRTKPEVLLDLDQKMSQITGKRGVIEDIANENDILIKRTLDELGLPEQKRNAENIYNVLIEKLKHIDAHLNDFLGKPDLTQINDGSKKLCDTALKLNDPQKGFFIKQEKAIQMLEKFPPNNLLKYFKYKTASELIEKQGFSSVFSSLRFAENNEWMHKFFDEAYNDLTADDFEERDVELKILDTKWLDVAGKFLKKKYHNVSHLKELGIIFIIPLEIDTPGETLRLFTLILHYLNEVPFYSKLFRKFANEDDFSEKVKSLLRGDVPESQDSKEGWMIIQRYLAKDDPNDPRLFLPHINPEVEHWYRAEKDLAKISPMVGEGGHAFGHWVGLDFVGNFFVNDQEKLVSFDLIDLVMSLVQKGEVKYLYHQQEALWYKIFVEYLGRDKVNQLIEENMINGFIEL